MLNFYQKFPLFLLKTVAAFLFIIVYCNFRAEAQQGFSSITNLNNVAINGGSGTHDKSQSKVFTYAGKHWAVLATTTGTHLFRLDGTSFTHILRLTTTKGRADCKVVGNLVHVFVYQKNTPQLISLEHVPADNSYKLWTVRPSIVYFSFNNQAQTATIDMDSNGRMWLAYVRQTNVVVQWSDYPYGTWSAPINIATNVRSDDAAGVVAMQGRIGVLWSNQNTQRWGFRTHIDGASPNTWTADEVPASQSALNVGYGMADDHFNMKLASDGTLYIAAKTGYNNPDYPLICMLVRRPNGSWDDLYDVSRSGTTPIVVLNEQSNKLRVIYASKTYGGDIQYNESSISNISFGPQLTLRTGTAYRDPTSSKQNPVNETVVLATNEPAAIATGVIAYDNTPGPSIPDVPSLLLPANNATNVAVNPTLSWNASTGAETYQVQVSANSNFSSSVFNQSGITGTSVQASGLANNTQYFWRARATNQAGTSNWSSSRSFTTISAPSSATLVGHWRMNEGSGSVLQDASGAGNHATLQNNGNVAWVAGVEGLALSLPGTSGRYAIVSGNSSLNITNAITIAAWIRPNTVRWSGILNRAGNGYDFAVGSNGKIEFLFNYVSSNYTYYIISNQNYPANGSTWMHAAVTFDGQTSKIYINGAEDASVTYAPATMDATSGNVFIGAYSNGSQRFNGALDDLRLYNGALSASEIQALYSQSQANASSRTLSSDDLDPNGESETRSLTDASLKISERFAAYPNPFSSQLMVVVPVQASEDYVLNLYHINGAIVRTIDTGRAAENQVLTLEIDGTDLPKGVYFIKFNSSLQSRILKVILE